VYFYHHKKQLFTFFVFAFLNIKANAQALNNPNTQPQNTSSLSLAPKLQAGGSMLEFPSGRFQESEPPRFFKWISLQKPDTQTLKLYFTHENSDYKSENLIAKFDFAGDIQSFNWSYSLLKPGYYTWVIESYQLKNSLPNYIDESKFKIETLKYFDFNSSRIGATLGFSRGTSQISSSNSDLKYDVTPVHYGLTYSAASKTTNLFSANIMANDFLLQGRAFREIFIQTDYLYPLNKPQNKFKFYLGPSLKVLSVPILYSTNTTTAKQVDLLVLNPGVSMAVQNHFDNNITLFSKANIEEPTIGTEQVRMSLNSTNFELRSGLIYGLIWPIGFSGELMYHYEPIKIKVGNETIESTRKELGVMATLLYVF
jgi:hypothetical protein